MKDSSSDLRIKLMDLQCQAYLSSESFLNQLIIPNIRLDELRHCPDHLFNEKSSYRLIGSANAKFYFWKRNEIKNEHFNVKKRRYSRKGSLSSIGSSSFSLKNNFFANYQSLNISQTSGTVSCAAITASGGVFIGSIAENHIDYNRIGELIYCKDGVIKYLKGHSIQSADSSVTLRQTVSDMKYCLRENLVFTVGYDGYLRIWDENLLPHQLTSFSTVNKHTEQIQPLMDRHVSKNCLAFTTTDSSIYLFCYGRTGESGEFEGRLQRILCRKKGQEICLDNEKKGSISGMFDCVQFKRNPCDPFVSFYALTGNSESPIPGSIYVPSSINRASPGGILEAFQLGAIDSRPARTFSFGLPNVGFSYVASQGASDNGFSYVGSHDFVGIGTGSTGENCILNGDGNFYLLNGSGNTRNPLIAKIHTGHYECEFASFSPCGLFFVSCNASNNEAIVYDVRYHNTPLHTFNHRGDTSAPIENVMSAYWSSLHPGKLWTGGADRYVKMWDVGRSSNTGPVGAIAHSHPVNVIGVDEFREEKFVVGTLNDASVYSFFPHETNPVIEYFS